MYTREADVELWSDSSMVLLRGLTDEGQQWLWKHLPEDTPRHGEFYAVERNYAHEILQGIAADGLVIE